MRRSRIRVGKVTEPERGAPSSLCEGESWDNESDGTVRLFAVFDLEEVERWSGVDFTEARRRRLRDVAGVLTALTGWQEEYNGPGQSFADAPEAELAVPLLIVTQRNGLDV